LYFQTRILFVSFAATVILAIFIIPILRKFKIGQIERDDGPESHLGKKGTPTMGGIIIAAGIIIGTIGGYIYYSKTDPEVGKRLFPLLLISIGFGLIGFIDDYKKLVLKNTKGLKPSEKMLGLLIIAVLFTLYLLKGVNLGTTTIIPFSKKEIVLPVLAYIPFAIFVMLGTTNAVNLTDGIDGLSTSISAIITTCLTVIAIILDVKEIVVFGSIIVGACLGFLIFNLNTAQVFMGDTGSLLLRRCNLSNGFVFTNATNTSNNSSNTSCRNTISSIASYIFQKNWRQKIIQNGTITSPFWIIRLEREQSSINILHIHTNALHYRSLFYINKRNIVYK